MIIYLSLDFHSYRQSSCIFYRIPILVFICMVWYQEMKKQAYLGIFSECFYFILLKSTHFIVSKLQSYVAVGQNINLRNVDSAKSFDFTSYKATEAELITIRRRKKIYPSCNYILAGKIIFFPLEKLHNWELLIFI